jgi:hypothetical protein
MLSFAALVVAASTVVGQAEAQPPSNYEHLKSVEWIVGTFEAKGKAQDGIPGVVDEGEDITFRLEFEWTLKKSAMVGEITIASKNGVYMRHRGMLGWNAADEQIVSGGFDSLGGMGVAQWNKDENGWKLKTMGALGNGTKTAGTLIFSDISDTGFTVQGIDNKHDGVEQEDGQVLIYKRVD